MLLDCTIELLVLRLETGETDAHCNQVCNLFYFHIV